MSSTLQGRGRSPRRCLIIVTGLPATGKSRFARTLASSLDLPLLAKDAIKEPLLDALGAVDAAASRRLSDLSFELLFALAAQIPGPGLILEGNFRRGEHELRLVPLLTPATSVAQVLCRLDEAGRRARLVARAQDAARHPGHRDSQAAGLGADTPTDQFLDLPGTRLELAGDASEHRTGALILELAHGLRPRSGRP